MQSKKWKKFGVLFKSRQAAVRRDAVPPGPTIGLPTGLRVLDQGATVQTNRVEGNKPEPAEHSQKHEDDWLSRPSTATDASIWSEPSSKPPVPKLELDIPNPALDRYSAMFRNLPAATRSSSLLARRSKTLESLRSIEDSRPTTKDGPDDLPKTATEPLTPPMPPRRLTTPTTTRSPAVSKYSLFPSASPAPVKITGRMSVSDTDVYRLKRTASSPARLSPMHDQFSVAKPQPLNPKRNVSNEQMANSPEDNTASTDREAPWSAAHSFQSSASSATTQDEIFFDIKSLRDSRGVEDGHFIMTRPDSTAVELARTRSKRAAAMTRLRQVEVSQQDDSHETTVLTPPPPSTTVVGGVSTATTKHSSVNTAYFDEAIAAVEKLTSPSTTADPLPEKTPPLSLFLPTVTISAHEAKTQQSSTPAQFTRPSDHHPARLANKWREEISRLIPSPVAEVREESSPRSESAVKISPSLPAPQPRQFQKVVSPQMVAIRQIDRPIDDSPTIPQGPPKARRAPKPPSPLVSEDKPPPVPKKDARFIPLSKYAAKGTVAKIEQAGIVPTRSVRANTETLVARSSSLRPSKERSATLPSYKSSLQGLEKTVPPRPNPTSLNSGTTEVAVARSVSLSRKRSARVLVPAPKLVSRRAEADAKAHRHHRSGSKSLSKDKIKIRLTKRDHSADKSRSRDTEKEKEREKQLVIQAAVDAAARRNWELLEKKSYSPVVVQAERGHKPGLSVGVVVESI